jgi:hypothetical protein
VIETIGARHGEIDVMNKDNLRMLGRGTLIHWGVSGKNWWLSWGSQVEEQFLLLFRPTSAPQGQSDQHENCPRS